MGTTTVRRSFSGMKMAPNQKAMSTRHTRTQPTKATGRRTDVTSMRSMRMLAGEKVMKVKPGTGESPDACSSVSSLRDERMTFTSSKAAGLKGSMVGNRKVSMACRPLLTSCSQSIWRFFEVCDRNTFLEKKFVRTRLMSVSLRQRTPSASAPWKVALTKLLAVRLYRVFRVVLMRWSAMWQLASKKRWSLTSSGFNVVVVPEY
mmetsp:Transcript_97624/g.304121  ORF Transcript_97624/g.304121 Transcript_97624/m.304121 type:complete len:204 (-) Transcript_97624:1664-2275(-)